MNRNTLALAFALVAASIGSTAHANDMCGVIMDECPPGTFPEIDDRCESNSPQLICVKSNRAPTHPRIECTRSVSGFSCSAWPKTAVSTLPLGYKWTLTGNLQFGSTGTIADPSMRTIRCPTPTATGTIKVEISAPVTQLISSTTMQLNCQQPVEMVSHD